MSVIDRFCHNCVSPATKVYVIPDPYYGYGYQPSLCCNNCIPSNIFCDASHQYDPEYDDYYLGFTPNRPISWMYSSNDQVCINCENIIISGNKVNKVVMIDGYFCEQCFLNYKNET